MTDAPDIANRHLLQAEGLAEKPMHPAQRVRIVVANKWAASRAGQLLTSCLVNLLVRQVTMVSAIDIVAPEANNTIPLPNCEAGERFPVCLTQIAAWAIKDHIPVSISKAPDGDADITVLIGARAPVTAGIVIFAVGNGWKAWVGDPSVAPADVVPDSENPLGPFFAAALAAGEVFKRCRGLLRGRFVEADGYSLWSGQTSADWNTLEDGPELTGADLPPAHIVGAGAVGKGLAYILANARLGDAYAVIIDDDHYDDTSLNRCLLAGWEDLKHPKIEAVAATLKRCGIGAPPFPGTVSQYLDSDRPGLRPDVASQVGDLTFEVVVSCVDRGVSRQHVQGLSPSLLFGGSTLGLTCRANFYADRPGAACLSCFNPAERDGDKLRAFGAETTRHEADRTRRLSLRRRDRSADRR
ncbi:ThiF family adenylyltransferase [Bradyrhizobium sp. Gha]|uniref:ThiF family adenylyltransferase n=1 Tax=Bradyrhizobium sp. Gha TaxID=1855318 RepID=UPI0008E111ED|nr:ThiF family adenylyltransferase [Bradyrhizobium sp. Gha]SFJ35577.1 ThiF family protein [Bradyrhizobium sp. Gha]